MRLWRRVSETLTIDVKPGWKKGTKIPFPEKGDEVGAGRGVFGLEVGCNVKDGHDYMRGVASLF